jgi:hypothetical protein
MKKSSTILNFLIVLLILAGLTHIGSIQLKGKHDRRDSRQFAEATILAIADNWDANELARRATPKLSKMLTPQHLRDIEMRKLGKIKRFDGVNWSPDPDCVKNDRSITSYSYQALVDFENGSARFILNLIKQDDKWQIFGYEIIPLAISR